LKLSAYLLPLLIVQICASASEPGSQPQPIAEVELRGTVVCLHEEMNQLHGTDLPPNHEHILGFKSAAFAYYTLLRTRWSEALFMDDNLRQKELVLRGRLLPGTQIFDVTRIRTVKDGAVCEVFYYCEICSIETISPRQCVCCQEPVELIERPLHAGGDSK
jgi:hypothetical protein